MMTVTSYLKIRISWILIALALLVGGLFSCPSQADKSVTNATKNLPPNAYYYYLKALDVRHQAAITNHTPPPPPPDTKRTKQQNLEPYYKKNAAEINADAEALEIVRQGFAFKYKRLQIVNDDHFDKNYIQDFSFKMGYLVDMFLSESDAKAKKGDWLGAASCALDAIRLGQDMTQGTVIDVLRGAINISIARKKLQQTLKKGNAVTIGIVTKRLEKILSQKVQYADVLQAEKQTGLWLFEEMATSPNWRNENHFKSTKSDQDLKKDYLSANG